MIWCWNNKVEIMMVNTIRNGIYRNNNDLAAHYKEAKLG